MNGSNFVLYKMKSYSVSFNFKIVISVIADSQGNKMLRQTPYKIEPNLQYFRGRKNAFSIEIMLPPHYKDNM